MARIDGRTHNMLRPVTFERNFTKYAAGSVLTSFGDTRVLCTATIEESVPRWMANTGKGWVTAEYAMLPGSSSERIRRDNNKKGRALEISRLIGRSLRAVVNMEALGECMITVDCDVLQADGGTRTAAITGGYVALCEACESLVAQGTLSATPLIGPCAAISVGVRGDDVLLDLCYEEDSTADVDMNVVMAGNGDFIEIQGSAEGRTFPRATMDTMIDIASKGCTELFQLQREALSLG